MSCSESVVPKLEFEDSVNAMADTVTNWDLYTSLMKLEDLPVGNEFALTLNLSLNCQLRALYAALTC